VLRRHVQPVLRYAVLRLLAVLHVVCVEHKKPLMQPEKLLV
jgi:hypothetical protein